MYTEILWTGSLPGWRADGAAVPCLCVIIIGCEERGGGASNLVWGERGGLKHFAPVRPPNAT